MREGIKGEQNREEDLGGNERKRGKLEGDGERILGRNGNIHSINLGIIISTSAVAYI